VVPLGEARTWGTIKQKMEGTRDRGSAKGERHNNSKANVTLSFKAGTRGAAQAGIAKKNRKRKKENRGIAAKKKAAGIDIKNLVTDHQGES